MEDEYAPPERNERIFDILTLVQALITCASNGLQLEGDLERRQDGERRGVELAQAVRSWRLAAREERDIQAVRAELAAHPGVRNNKQLAEGINANRAPEDRIVANRVKRIKTLINRAARQIDPD